MADVHGSPGDAPQMPQAGAGPAPVPYAGPSMSTEPPGYAPAGVSFKTPGPDVLSGVTGAMGVQESGYAHDTGAGLIAPYYPGHTSAIYAGGDNDPGGRDDVEATVAGAVAAAEARYLEYQADTFSQGSTIGDLMTLPTVPENIITPPDGFGYAQGNQPGA